MKFVKVLVVLLILCTFHIYGVEFGEISIAVTSGASLPLGDSTSYFTIGGGGGLSTDLRLKSLPLFFLKLDSCYTYIPLQTLDDGVNVYSATAGGGVTIDIMEKINLAAYGTGGYFYSIVNDGSGSAGGNISLKGGVLASYALSPSFSLIGDLYYLYNFYLNQGIGLSGGVSYSFPSGRIERRRYSPPVRPEPLDETNNNELSISVTPGTVVPIGPADEYVKTGGSVDEIQIGLLTHWTPYNLSQELGIRPVRTP